MNELSTIFSKLNTFFELNNVLLSIGVFLSLVFALRARRKRRHQLQTHREELARWSKSFKKKGEE